MVVGGWEVVDLVEWGVDLGMVVGLVWMHGIDLIDTNARRGFQMMHKDGSYILYKQ